MAGRVKSRQKRISMRYITIILVIMLASLLFLSYRLNQQKDQLLQQKASYEKQLEEENERTQDIEDFADSTKTKEFIEQTAKEKLGLLYANEILFKKKN